jgi:glucosyl-3-phosphoglycerate synthase
LGYVLASGRARVVAVHDADVLTHSRDMLARLVRPVIDPTFDYVFCKGYYFRAGDGRLNGRVARLFVTPLLRALRTVVGPDEYLDYLESFRYPLAGEFAMRAEAVPAIRVPSDWGLELGMLGEVHRSFRPKQICQVDIAGAYDHKHQELSAEDPAQGLHKMSIDIAKAVFRRLALDGRVLAPEHFRTLEATFHRMAIDLVDHYRNDAVLNGYAFDRHAEVEAVELFARSLLRAGDEFLADPMDTPYLPSWSQVIASVPDALTRLEAAVEADQQG